MNTATINSALLALAHQMADAAAAISLPAFEQGVRAELKADATPVTQADLTIETTLRAMIAEHFPDHSVLGEELGEGATSQKSSPYRWILDPIDGTRAFISGMPSFSTLIALEHQGEAVLGIADFPAMNKRFVGTPASATLNGHAITTSKLETLSDAVVATTSTYYFSSEQRGYFDALAASARSYQLGGDAYPYCMLACGRVDVAVDVGCGYHDIAGMLPILLASGASLKLKEVGGKWNIVAAATPDLLTSALSVFPL